MNKYQVLLRRGLMLMVVLNLAVFTSCDSSNEKIPFDGRVLTGRLENGLTYYLRRNEKPAARLELRLVVRSGSVLEADDQQGLAHFLEHMAFNGTEHFEKNTLVDYLESIGMRFGPDLNAYTSFDQTVYELQVPTAKAEAVDTGFQILRDWAFGMKNDDAEIDRERGVVVEEWRLRRGAGQRIRDRQFPVLFHGSQYANRLPIGKKEVLDTFAHDRLRAFYRDWYKPEVMAVVAVGALEPAEMLRQVREHFGDVPASRTALQLPKHPVPNHEKTLVSIVTDPEATDSSVTLYFKLPTEPLKTVTDYRNRLADALISSLLGQRLDELRQKADPPFLRADTYKGPYVRTSDVFLLGAQVKDGGFRAGLEAVLAEAARVAQHGFTDTELARGRIVMLAAMEKQCRELETTESAAYAGEYTDTFVYDTTSPGVEAELLLHKELLPKITLGELNARVKDWMSRGSRVILVNGPEKPGLVMPTEQEVLATYEQVSQAAVKPYVDDVAAAPLLPQRISGGDIVKRERIDELDLTIWTLSNGARMMLKPTKFKQDQILFRAYSPGGHSLASDDAFIPAAGADEVVSECGLGAFSKVQLTKKLAGKIVSLQSSIEELREGLSGSCRPEDLETFMQLLYLQCTTPRADEQAFAAYCASSRTDLKNRLSQPEAVFSDEIQIAMSQGHPRRQPWRPETVDRFDLRKSLDFYRTRFDNARDFTFLLVGDFDLRTMEKFARDYIAALPSTGETEEWKDLGIRRPTGVVDKTVNRGMEPKSRVQLIYSGDFAWSYENRYAMQSLLSELNIRLREKIREDMGGVYAIGAYAAQEHYPRQEYAINIVFGCAPDQVQSVTAAVRQQVQLLRDEPISDMDLGKIKEIQLKERQVSLEQNEFWLYVLDFYDWNGEDPRVLLDFEKYVNGLTKDKIREAANTYFGTPNVATFVLLPEDPTSK